MLHLITLESHFVQNLLAVYFFIVSIRYHGNHYRRKSQVIQLAGIGFLYQTGLHTFLSKVQAQGCETGEENHEIIFVWGIQHS
jgi:hypothetical protein